MVIDSQYFAPLIAYLRIDAKSYIEIEQYDYFRKMSFRNRCTVAGSNGAIKLTIPIRGGRDQRTIMKEVRIDNSVSWQMNHFKTIESVYNKSPWFDFYRDELFELYQGKMEFLIEWNFACFKWVADKLSIKVAAAFTEQYVGDYPSPYLDHRNLYLPSTINQQFPDAIKYPQVFEDRTGFLPHMSVLDWLFCMGNTLPNPAK